MPGPQIPTMSRKPKKGYFVKGHFVAEGSELDQELKLAMKWGQSTSKTDAKRESEELQELGEQLLALRGDQGARAVLQRHAPHLLALEDVGCVLDVDTPDLLAQAQRLAGPFAP